MINKSIMLEKMKKVRRMSMLNFLMSVSYTHLTLPTIA